MYAQTHVWPLRSHNRGYSNCKAASMRVLTLLSWYQDEPFPYAVTAELTYEAGLNPDPL